MHPTSTPDYDLPGVDDYQVTIPVHRDGTAAEVRLRLPAASNKGAVMLGQETARYLATAIRQPDDAPEWKVAIDQVTAERVDTPSAEELAGEVEHWKRIVTALARKMPGLLQVTSGEYSAADTADLTALPADDDTMMFVTPAFYAELAAHAAAQQQPVVLHDLPEREEPLLLPAGDDQLPADPGGPDPDIRRIQVGRLGEFHGDQVEIFAEGWWLPVQNVDSDDTRIVLTVSTRHTPMGKHGMAQPTSEVTYFDPTVLVPVRPATRSAGGYSLARHRTPSVAGQQLLHEGAWWTIRDTDLDYNAKLYTVALISADHGNKTALIDQESRITMRRRRPGAWF